MLENRTLQAWRIPQYHNLRLKLPRYHKKISSMLTTNPNVPLKALQKKSRFALKIIRSVTKNMMCHSRKYAYLPQGGLMEILRGKGS